MTVVVRKEPLRKCVIVKRFSKSDSQEELRMMHSIRHGRFRFFSNLSWTFCIAGAWREPPAGWEAVVPGWAKLSVGSWFDGHVFGKLNWVIVESRSILGTGYSHCYGESNGQSKEWSIKRRRKVKKGQRVFLSSRGDCKVADPSPHLSS